MTARPPCTQPCKGTHSCALHWGFLQPSPEAAQHVLMETSQRAVSAETALGALDGFIQDCLPDCQESGRILLPYSPQLQNWQRLSTTGVFPHSPKQVSSSHPTEKRMPSKH